MALFAVALALFLRWGGSKTPFKWLCLTIFYRIVRSHLDYTENLISQVDSAIDTMIAKFKSLIAKYVTKDIPA